MLGGLLPVMWRLHMLAWGAGWELADEFRSGGLLVYVLGLIVLEALASVAPLALVQRWGEVWPGWVPRLGGRRISPTVVAAVASLGAALTTIIIAVTFWQLASLTAQGISNPITQVEPGWHRAFMLAHYVPWVLWPAGLWVAIVGFVRRHRVGRGGP